MNAQARVRTTAGRSAEESAVASPHAILQRKCACGTHTVGGAECDDCGRQKLQRRAASADERGAREEAPAVVHDVLRSSGRPLDSATRSFMEQRFVHDFSRVQATSPQRAAAGGLEVGPQGDRFEQEADRHAQLVMRAPGADARGGPEALRRQDFGGIRIHTDAKAAESARAVNALAYTVGNHLIFGAGQYAPETEAGKQLLAHELTHAVQQGGSHAAVQRACDPTVAPLSTRAKPVFFPHETKLVSVFGGAATLKESATPTPDTAVGLVQQALVDLGINLGATGPNGDGVDKLFDAHTTAGVTAFQTAQSIPGVAAGEVDRPTLKCLDEQRAHVAVAPNLKPGVRPGDVQVNNPEAGGRDEDIFFDRGDSTLDADAEDKIKRLLTRAANPLKGCPVTLEGFTSEDELVEFGPGLAGDRINAVSAEFARQKHDDPGPACTSPTLPLRTPSPLPAASSGVSGYRARRKVEVVPAGKSSTTASCPSGSAQHRALNGPESKTLKDAVKMAVGWMNAAIGKLTPGNKDGDDALTAYFGGASRRSTIKANLAKWRDHLKFVVPVKNRHGTDCLATCRTAVAFNEGRGPSAQMTVCPSFFGPLAMHPTLSADQKQAFVMMHEAGHGSIGTRDTAYGHARLIEFLADFPAIAEENTDSYALMVLCLKGFPGFCKPPQAADTTAGMNDAEKTKSRRGIGWLQTWLTWTQQDTSSMYRQLNLARGGGQSIRSLNTYYADVFDVLAAAFKLRRPGADAPPTFSEQTFVAAVLDRLLEMQRAAKAGLEVEKDAGPTPTNIWLIGPGRKVFLTDAYFALATDRERVETLLPLILRASTGIALSLEKNYETFIKEDVKKGWDNKP